MHRGNLFASVRHSTRLRSGERDVCVKSEPKHVAQRKFTADQVRAIRADARSCAVIGAELGVSRWTIRHIKDGINYSWVE